jgi:hypothetical protein
MWKESPTTVKAFWKKNKTEGFSHCDYKLYFKIIVIKTAWYYTRTDI